MRENGEVADNRCEGGVGCQRGRHGVRVADVGRQQAGQGSGRSLSRESMLPMRPPSGETGSSSVSSVSFADGFASACAL